MDEEQRSLLIRSFSHYSSSPGQELHYGVHGIVGEESVLRSACYRIGIVAALRSIKSKSVTGVMITACGGSVKENGVRIVDPDGGALIADWEPVADSVANVVDPDDFVTLIEELGKKENISFDGGQSAEVLLARDTSPSGEALLEAAKQGISSVAGTIVHDMGILTLPQLHWLVHARNKGRSASEHDYLQHLSYCYRCLVDLIPEATTTDKVGESLIVDGANSVSGDKIEALKDLCDGLAIEVRNSSKGCAIPDQEVGFDFIREQKTVPSGFGSSDIGFRCASLDRDGDRLLYFSVLPSQEIEIIDGDKILFLFALFIKEQLTVLQEVDSEKEVHYGARLVILQSDYENRESGNYLESLGLDIVSFTQASTYDIGIYFEPDGRGGILFSKNYLLWLEDKNNELLSSSEGSRKQLTVSRLLAVSRLMNTTLPDALASLLMVEAILQHNGWSLQKWNENYFDLANRKHSEVELAEEIAAAIDDSKTVAIGHSGTKEEDDTLTVEARSENANVSLLSQESEKIDEVPTESAEQAVNYVSLLTQESENINEGPTESAELAVNYVLSQESEGSTESTEQAVNYEVRTGEQTDVDVSAELGQNQKQETITYFQPCENGTHAELVEGFQERHESQTVPLQSDETSDAIELEARAEEVHRVIKRSTEEHEFDAEEAKDPEYVHDKEETEIKRELDDDTWVLVTDGPLNEKESGLSPESNGIHTPDENVEDSLLTAGTAKVEDSSILESSFDAQSQSHMNSSLHLPDTTDYEHLPELNDSLAKAEGGGVISASESASDAEPQSQTSSCVHLPELNEPEGEKESCSSPENGIDTQSENDDLLVSFDPKREEVGDNIGLERVPSVIVQDEQLETKAQNGSINVDNESNCNVNVDNGSSNDISVPIDSGEALPIFSNGSATEEAGDPNAVEYASCTKASSEVNGIVVALTPNEHVTKVEAIADNSQIDIDANYLVNGKNSDIGTNISSSEVYSEEPSTDDGVGIKPPSPTSCTISSIDHDGILNGEAENGGFNAENGDANLSVAEAEELSSPCDIVRVEKSAADGAGTVKQEAEVNNGITILPVIEVTEPEINSGNDQAEVESKSDSLIDNEEIVSSPFANRTEETEMGNEIQTVSDNQSPSLTNGSSLDAVETETITVSDGIMPEIQVNSHDAQETYLQSTAENSPASGDKLSDCFVTNSSNWEITIGSMQCVCPKSETPSMGSEVVCHDDSTSSKDDSDCDLKAKDTLPSESVAEKESDINDRSAVNETVHVVETNLDEESTSSLEGSATAVGDGQNVTDEIEKKPFYYLIRTPKYDDEKLSEQIRLAEMLLREKTIVRDAALAEYRHKKENCQNLRANQQGAVLEERAARDLVRLKRKEIDSAQSLVNIAKDAMTIEDLDNKIANMEHTIQHETILLNEEKKLIREIKQSAKMREQLLATTKNQGFQQALDHKEKNEDQVKALRKELDALRNSLSEKERAVAAAVKILDSEHAILNELHRKLMLSNDVRQEAFSNLQNLKSQWSEKNKYFWTCKNAQIQANKYAASGDKASLQSVCVDQVESVMELWNTDNEFRRDYIRCNLRSTLRRLGTPDGRSLGPDEEAPLLPIPPARRIIPSVKDRKETKTVVSHPEPVVKLQKVDPKSANKVPEQKKSAKNATTSSKKEEEAQASNSVKIEEEKEALKASKEQEDLKALKEQEELARKAEELRKIEEDEKLKEKRRLEEKVKFQEALERKRRKAEKAQAKVELRLKRQAEEKEKERERRAKKKGSKNSRISEDTASIPETEIPTTDAVSEQPREAETREKPATLTKNTQKYAKQNKVKTILAPPPPLRNRGKRRTTQQWMWVAVTVLAVLILFFLGNLNFPEIRGRILSSWH